MPPPSLASVKLNTIEIILLIGVAMLSLPAMYLVHCGLEYCYLVYARRFCSNHGFKLVRWRCGPALDRSGIKTEFTILELDCLDAQNQRKLVCLLVWIFGIRKVLSNENYPEPPPDAPPAS